MVRHPLRILLWVYVMQSTRLLFAVDPQNNMSMLLPAQLLAADVQS